MLSLVEYESSGSEDESNSTEPTEDKCDEKDQSLDNSGTVQIITPPNKENGDVGNIFEILPKPNVNPVNSIVEEEDEFLKKKEVPTEKPKRQPIKINVPSLSEFDSDEDETPAKKVKVDSKSCGLFALLPPPKTTPITTKHFVPNVVKRNANRKATKPKKNTIPNKSIKNNTTEIADSDDDEDVTNNLPDTFDDEMWQKLCGRKEKHVKKPIIEEPTEENKTIQLDPEVKKPYEGLDNQAFKELIGTANKHKDEIIDIVDIKEDEILSDKKLWMTKSLTDPEMAPKYVIQDPVNDTCRRKHHITYLAQQAQATEQELQNQWAQSRFTRQKTQAKYGF